MTFAKMSEAKRANSGSSVRRRPPALTHIALGFWLVVSFVPLLWALSGSFKPLEDIFITPPQIVPSNPTVENYSELLTRAPFARWFITSALVASSTAAVSTFLAALAGFGFAKYRFPGERVLFNIVLSALMVPFAIILVPLFVEITRLGLANSYFTYAIPFLLPAFGVFMMRQFILGVPSEVIESARVDGAREFRIFITVVLPLIRPAIGALFVWFFLAVYNDFLWPATFVSDSSMYTLPLGLNSLRTAFSTEYGLVLAGTMLAALPTILIFISLRRQLIDGLAAGAVKG
ncbi:carbohydrate ABC transporter permease [Ruania alba]|uniref:Carbohydrate ABC transporter membrane protein 2, CUT1 family n=1 Tax=Ruania alba TaxID=648782 RepID=A0A1H5MLF0_9MICO|nr:carbohydrate ABC transporter permease [Ruania alba]SEE89228.1 carbohydrate ABC transporter membrane protein 2, CUT1 family [Ruania alba]